MDGSRFDGFVRALATGSTRRRTLQGVASGGVAGLLAHLRIEATTAACVKPGKRGCKGPRNQKCCGGARCRGGTSTKEGRCVCAGRLTKCGAKCVNTKTDKQHCGRCNRLCRGTGRCQNGTCVSELGCRAGDQHCENPGVVFPCPGTDNQDCVCVTDVEGTPRCVDFGVDPFNCDDPPCLTNANCGPGRVCIDANGVRCCDGTVPGGTCVAATCEGKT